MTVLATRARRAVLLGGFAALFALVAPAHAADYPQRPVALVVEVWASAKLMIPFPLPVEGCSHDDPVPTSVTIIWE